MATNARVSTHSLFVALFLVPALAALPPRGASAQEPLTLDGAIRATLSQNATLRASVEATAEADARATAARSGFFPRLTVSESWQRGDQPVFVFSSLLSARKFTAADFALDALNHPDPVGLFQTRFAVEQLVYDGGRQQSQATAAALRRDMSRTARDEVAATLVLTASETFGRVLAAQSALQAASAGMTAAREDLARAERRRDVGVATEADVLSLRVHVADMQQQAIAAEGRVAVGRAELNRLMGLPVDHVFVAIEPADGAAPQSSDLPSLLAEAEAARPELKRAVMAEELADASKREARSAFIPQVAAQAAFDVSGTEFSDRATAWIFGGEVRWSFSTGGGERAQSKAAGHAAARARAEREDARAAVHVDVVRALRGLEAARARFAAGRAAVEQARESQRMIRDRFEAGVAGVNDVLRASTALLDAEANRTSALVDAVVNQALLDRALGRAQTENR